MLFPPERGHVGLVRDIEGNDLLQQLIVHILRPLNPAKFLSRIVLSRGNLIRKLFHDGAFGCKRHVGLGHAEADDKRAVVSEHGLVPGEALF